MWSSRLTSYWAICEGYLRNGVLMVLECPCYWMGATLSFNTMSHICRVSNSTVHLRIQILNHGSDVSQVSVPFL